MNRYKQLTYDQRCQIEVLKKSGFSEQCIADAVGVSQSSISRELARNTVIVVIATARLRSGQ